jgi:hypothetical protein
MCMNILTFPQWKEISTGVGQPSTSREQEGIRECEDVQISGYGVWTKTAKDEVQTCKVNWMSLIINNLAIIVIQTTYNILLFTDF